MPAIGIGSHPTEYIKTWDSYLHDVDIPNLPFLVVNVRTVEKDLDPEIGQNYGKYIWTVHIYYLDMSTEAGGYDAGDVKRDHILAKIEKTLEANPFLQSLEVVDTDGHREYVYSSSVELIDFDASGQDQNQSFVSELHFQVKTDRS
jgi:hypothetical protein